MFEAEISCGKARGQILGYNSKVLMFVYGLEWLWLNVVLSILVSGLDHFFDYRLLALSYYRFG